MVSTPLPPDDGENNRASELPTSLRLSDVEWLAEPRLDGVAAEGSPEVPTPLPPGDGESHHASELPTGLRLSDVERLAAERLDGAAAEGSPEVPTPLPPNDGENNYVLQLPTGLRLSDAEQIAAQRLDGAAEGALEEALAIVAAGDPGKAAPSLADRVEAVGESLAAEPQAHPVDAKPTAEVSAEQAMLAQVPEQSAVAPIEGAVAALPTEGFATPSPLAVVAPTEDMHVPAGDTSQVAVAAPSLGAGVAVRPLSGALDAAAKLAADANAAAEALENLKRLLERRLPNVAANPAPAAADVDTQTSAGAPAMPAAPTMPPLLPSLPPLPLHAVRDASGRSTLRPALLAPPPTPPHRAPAERTRLDVRGFLAGFALSGAFGVVLYLFMTAG